MTITTFVSLTRLTAMLATGSCLLAAADGASTKDGVAEVPAALNPDKLSIFRVCVGDGRAYTCTPNPAGATGRSGSGSVAVGRQIGRGAGKIEAPF